MQYKGGARKSLPAIARELNVDAIVEGTVSQSGQKVRITAQLMRAWDDRHLWSEKYERDLADVLPLQGEVARAIASQIRIKLTAGEQTSLTPTRKVNPEAYDAFLKGNFFLHQGIRGTGKSIELFKRAIELDPLQAEAHAGLAQALCFAGIFGLRPSAETFPEARVAALKALELDESNAVAHNALADVKKGYDWDPAGTEVEYRRALQLNPSHLLTRWWYAECLTRMGRYDEAIAESDRALALDPVSPGTFTVRAMLFFRARRYDEAIRDSQQALDLDPNFINAFWWQGMSYAGKHDFPKSIACLTRAVSMNDGPLFRALLGHVYGRAGERAKALGMLDEVTALARQRYVSPVDFAVVYAGLGDADSTFPLVGEGVSISRNPSSGTGVDVLRRPTFGSPLRGPHEATRPPRKAGRSYTRSLSLLPALGNLARLQVARMFGKDGGDAAGLVRVGFAVLMHVNQQRVIEQVAVSFRNRRQFASK
jgi:tetratricopeptide (TPR) repeat protein